ncbi:MAG: TonB-dependent receptor [Gammaproteobacteria bacterium]
MNPCRKSVLGAAVALLCQAMPAHADDSVPVVVVVAHYNNAVGVFDSASSGRINQALLENRPALRTGELLEFVPGMIVTQHSGDGKANQYFLRGFNLDHGTDFATYVDGMPVNMRSHAHGQGYTDLNFIIPELVNRIEYNKGPYAAEDGDFASAGTARMRLSDRLKERQASVSVGADGYRRAMVATDAMDKRLIAAAELTRTDGPWDVPERLRKFNGLLRWHEGDRDNGYSVTAMVYRNRWHASDQIPRRAVESGALGRYATVDPSSGGQTSRASLSFSAHRQDADGRTEAEAYAVRSHLNLFSNFTYALERPAQGDQFEQAERRTLAGGQVSRTWDSELAGMALRSRVGAQLRHDALDPVGLYAAQGGARQQTVRENAVSESSVGLFGETSIVWHPKLRSVTGLRYDRYRARVTGADLAGTARAGDGQLSPRASLVLGPWNDTEFFVSAGRGFHSNDARAASAGPALLAASRGLELGVRSEAIEGLQSSLTLWRLDLDSELLYVGDAGTTEAGRASRRMGVEWSNHYVLRDWLLLDLDLAVSRSRYRDGPVGSRQVPGALAKMGSFGITVPAQGRWSGSLHLRYFGPRALTEDGAFKSSATAVLYGRVGMALGRGLRLDLDAFNLTGRRASDIEYAYTSRLPGESAAGVEDIHFHPVEPRTLRLTLSYRF